KANRRYVADLTLARKRIWITTAYFNLGPRILRALLAAKHRGVDVRLVVPHRSDVSFFPWLSRAMFAGCIKHGIEVYEFNGPMQHAKTTLFDDRAIVGSTNLNHRSYFRDLELDIVLDSSTAIETLSQLFLADCARSMRMTTKLIAGYAPFAYTT